MLKLKLQYSDHLMWRTDSLEKTRMLGKIEGRRRRGQQRMRWLEGMTDSMDMSFNKLRGLWWTGKPGMLQSMGSQRVGHDWAIELKTSIYYFQIWYSASAALFCFLSWCDSLFLVPTIFQPKLLRGHPQYCNFASKDSFSKLGTVKIVHSKTSKINEVFADVSFFEVLNPLNLI